MLYWNQSVSQITELVDQESKDNNEIKLNVSMKMNAGLKMNADMKINIAIRMLPGIN